MGLTIKGIKILRDNYKIFSNALNKFNRDKLYELTEVEDIKQNITNKDIIQYLNNIINVLNQYHIDSQGFCEYMRAIIEGQDIEVEKIWREIKGENEKRYSRCLLFNLNSKTYLLDSVDKILKEINIDDLDRKIFVFNPEENEYPYYGG